MPFRDLGPDAWRNLAIAALALVYVLQIALEIAWGNLFGNLGADFASFWSAGHLANRLGYGSVYDLGTMSEVQSALVPAWAEDLTRSRIIPTPYLPIFILPFQLLALLPPAAAAALWMILSLVGSALYMWSFAARIGVSTTGRRQLMLLMVSVPLFLNLFLGQVNLWLMICVGEFLLNLRRGRSPLAGFWLAGLLLKPQTLMLIVPVLFLQRWMKVGLAFLVASVTAVAASWLLAGTAAISSLAHLWLGYVSGLPSNDPQLMMNWRMLSFHAQSLIGKDAAAVLAGSGMALTAATALLPWIRKLDAEPARRDLALLALMAGTTLLAWHSHVHMAMIVIPPLMIVFADRNPTFQRPLRAWVLFPAAVHVLRLILAALTRADALPTQTYAFLDLLGGIAVFCLNLYLVIWSVRALRSQTEANTAPS